MGPARESVKKETIEPRDAATKLSWQRLSESSSGCLRESIRFGCSMNVSSGSYSSPVRLVATPSGVVTSRHCMSRSWPANTTFLSLIG